MRSVYTSKIISSHKDLVALVFYGTEQSKNPSNSFKHVYVYHNLDEPGKLHQLILSQSFGTNQNPRFNILQYNFKVMQLKRIQN